MNQPLTATQGSASASRPDVVLDEHDPRVRVDTNIQLYAQASYGIRNNHISRERALEVLDTLDRSSRAARGNLPNQGGANALRTQRLTEASEAARHDFDAAWPPAAPEAHRPHRVVSSRAQRRGRTTRALRQVVARLREGVGMGPSLSALTQGMRSRDVVALTAHTSTADLTRMAARAGASPAEAAEIAEALGQNAAAAFHDMVRDETVTGLDRAATRIERQRRPAARNRLVRALLRDPLTARNVFRALTGGQHASEAEELLERYDTTASPAERRAIELELRGAVDEALGQAQERVAELRQQVLNGGLGTAMDTQLYEIAPGAVDRVTRGLRLARSQGRSMTHGEATGESVLEAGVAHHTAEVAHDEHLAEATVLGASIAFGLFAGFATGGASTALVAGLLRTAMVGGGRYAADSVGVENTRAAVAGELATEADVERAEATRDTHLQAALTEAATEAVVAGTMHQLEHGLPKMVELTRSGGKGEAVLEAAEELVGAAQHFEGFVAPEAEVAVAHGAHHDEGPRE